MSHLPSWRKAASPAWMLHVVPFQGGINPSVQGYLLLTGEKKKKKKDKNPGLAMNTISLIFLLSDLPVLYALYGFIKVLYVDRVIENKFSMSQTIKFPFSSIPGCVVDKCLVLIFGYVRNLEWFDL